MGPMADRDPSELHDAEEVEAILSKALHRRERKEGLTTDELREVAREVGIDPASLDAAIAEVREDKLVADEEARLTRRRRSAFGVHLFVYAMINLGFLLALRRFAFPILFAWGIGLFFHALSSLPWARVDRLRFRRKLEKRRRKQELERSARELGEAAQAGLGAVLRTAADVLDRDRASKPAEGFGAKPAQGFGAKPAQGFGAPRPAEPIVTPSPKVRVEVEEAELVETPSEGAGRRERDRS